MSKTFRAWDVDQAWLLPPSVHEFVPAGHLAHFVRDTVREALDLSAIMGEYKAGQGQPLRAMADKNPPRRAAKPVPLAKTGGRARLRPNQAGRRIPTVPPPRVPQSSSGMVHALHSPQSPQALRRRTVSENSIPTTSRHPTSLSTTTILGQAPRLCKALYDASIKEGGVWGSPTALAALNRTGGSYPCHLED